MKQLAAKEKRVPILYERKQIYKIEDPRFQTQSKILMKSGKLSSVRLRHLLDFSWGGFHRRRRRRKQFARFQEYRTS